MKYKDYKAAIKGATNEELEKLLKEAENDFNNISDRQYYNLKSLILEEMYNN